MCLDRAIILCNNGFCDGTDGTYLEISNNYIKTGLELIHEEIVNEGLSKFASIVLFSS